MHRREASKFNRVGQESFGKTVLSAPGSASQNHSGWFYVIDVQAFSSIETVVS